MDNDLEAEKLIEKIAQMVVQEIGFTDRAQCKEIAHRVFAREKLLEHYPRSYSEITSRINSRVSALMREKNRKRTLRRSRREGQTLEEIKASSPPPPSEREQDYNDRHRH